VQHASAWWRNSILRSAAPCLMLSVELRRHSLRVRASVRRFFHQLPQFSLPRFPFALAIRCTRACPLALCLVSDFLTLFLFTYTCSCVRVIVVTPVPGYYTFDLCSTYHFELYVVVRALSSGCEQALIPLPVCYLCHRIFCFLCRTSGGAPNT
jgi:hypothetical protein